MDLCCTGQFEIYFLSFHFSVGKIVKHVGNYCSRRHVVDPRSYWYTRWQTKACDREKEERRAVAEERSATRVKGSMANLKGRPVERTSFANHG